MLGRGAADGPESCLAAAGAAAWPAPLLLLLLLLLVLAVVAAAAMVLAPVATGAAADAIAAEAAARWGPALVDGVALDGRRRAPEVEDAVARDGATPPEREEGPARVVGGRGPGAGPEGRAPNGPAADAPRGVPREEVPAAGGGAPTTPRADVADVAGRRRLPTPWGGGPLRADGESPAREEGSATSRPRGDLGAARSPAEEQDEEEFEAPLVGWARRRATERGTALLAASVLLPLLSMGAAAPLLALAPWARRERAAEPAERPGAPKPEADDVSGAPAVCDGLWRNRAARGGGCMGDEPVSPLATTGAIGLSTPSRGDADRERIPCGEVVMTPGRPDRTGGLAWGGDCGAPWRAGDGGAVAAIAAAGAGAGGTSAGLAPGVAAVSGA